MFFHFKDAPHPPRIRSHAEARECRALGARGGWPEARLAERRDYEPRSGEGVWRAHVPTLLKNIT
jgi:hypothetical protein